MVTRTDKGIWVEIQKTSNIQPHNQQVILETYHKKPYMPHPTQTLITDNLDFRRSIASAFDPSTDYSEVTQAEIDGTFEAIVFQLLSHYQTSQASPEFTESKTNQLPETGDTVTWKWGKGRGVGTVTKVYTEPTTITIEKSKITRNGTEENPALLIAQDNGSKVLKLASEVTVTRDADPSDTAIAFSFDFDGRYDDIDLTPTKGMVQAAKKALDYINEGYGGDGLEDSTIRWVRKVAKGEPLSIEKAKKGYKFFQRHNYFKQNKNKGDTNPNSPAPWYVARMAWFGDDGERFFNRVWRQIKAADSEFNEPTPYGNAPEFGEFEPEFGCVIHKVIPWNGLKLGVEYRPGDIRFKGSKHERKLKSGYGHIRGYKGNDKEALDCYLAPGFFDGSLITKNMFLVEQLKADTGEFDEEKILIGYNDIDHAKECYLTEMSPQHFGSIKLISLVEIDKYHKRHCNKNLEKLIKSLSDRLSQLEFEQRSFEEVPKSRRKARKVNIAEDLDVDNSDEAVFEAAKKTFEAAREAEELQGEVGNV